MSVGYLDLSRLYINNIRKCLRLGLLQIIDRFEADNFEPLDEAEHNIVIFRR